MEQVTLMDVERAYKQGCVDAIHTVLNLSETYGLQKMTSHEWRDYLSKLVVWKTKPVTEQPRSIPLPDTIGGKKL